MAKSILPRLGRRLRAFIPDLADLPESVWKRSGALNTWGTNAIEGNTLTHADVERLLLEGLSVPSRPVPDVVETLQHEQAFGGLLLRCDHPFDLVVVQELHEQVFRGFAAKRPGQWRLSNPYIAGTSYRPPRREQVVKLMDEWATRLEAGLSARGAAADPVPLAAWAHHRFEQVHPFEDGSGRAGRLVLNLGLLRLGWPPVHILPPDRTAYLDALEAGNGGDLAPFESFLRIRLARGMLDLLDQVGDEQDRLQDLDALAGLPWNPHKADYLALRCRQGVLPGIRAGETSGPMPAKRGRPRWMTSEAAMRLWLETKTG